MGAVLGPFEALPYYIECEGVYLIHPAQDSCCEHGNEPCWAAEQLVLVSASALPPRAEVERVRQKARIIVLRILLRIIMIYLLFI
jgi:hypothetical protein